MVKKIVLAIVFCAVCVFVILLCIGLYTEYKLERNMLVNNSHIIGTNIVCEQLVNNHDKCVLSLISPTCSSCFKKLNNIREFQRKSPIDFDVNIIVVGDSTQYSILNDVITDYKFNFIFDPDYHIIINNKYLSVNYMYLIGKDGTVEYAGEPFVDQANVNLFVKFLSK